jgi:catechol 2,3-dioxygenase-like lactoylglutathione lyase family enzyme
MLASAPIIAFVTVSSPDHALDFYRDTLRLNLVEESQYAMVFDCSGVMLRVAIAKQIHPTPHTVLGWQVKDIAATINALLAEGVKFQQYGFLEQDDLGVWTSPGGNKIAWFVDPDGNVLSLTEFAE